MTSRSVLPAWPADAAKVVALPREVTGKSTGNADDDWLDWLHSAEASDIQAKKPRERVSGWVALLKSQPDFRAQFLRFAYSPGETAAALPAAVTTPSRRWSTLVELYEAWGQLAADGEVDLVEKRGWSVAQAYLARTRWLLLSLPFRPGWEEKLGQTSLRRVDDSSARIVTLALQARDDWLTVLSQIDDYPGLKSRIDVENEAQFIAGTRITRARLRKVKPGLDAANASTVTTGEESADPAGEEVARFVITRLLLPRFALCRVWRIVYGASGGDTRAAKAAAGALAVCGVTLILMALGLAAQVTGLPRWMSDLPRWAPLGAAAWYALIAVTAAIRPATAWPWLLRQPASAAVGLLALAAAPPDWWYGAARRGAIWAAIALVLIGTGYLYVEAGSHGLRGRQRAGRPLAVAAAGFLHALMVTFIGLRFILPEFAAHAAPQSPGAPSVDLSCWFQPGHSACGPAALQPWLMVLVAAAWCFAAGVFLQIIWDDQPVTAPLAHVSWHRGS